MANPQSKPYFSPKNWLYGAAYGVNGKRYSQQPAQDYEINEDGTITAYGGTHTVQTDSQGRKYFDILIPETTNPHGLQQGFDYKDSFGRVIGRGETYNRYYINNLIPTPQQKPPVQESVVVKELVTVPPTKPKQNTSTAYSSDKELSSKKSQKEKKPERVQLGDGINHIVQWDDYSPTDIEGFEYRTYTDSLNNIYRIDGNNVTKQKFTQYTDSLRQLYDNPIIIKSDTFPGLNGENFIIQHRNFVRKDDNKIDKSNNTVAAQETSSKPDTLLERLCNLFSFKLGGTINYTKFYN